jgi:hypothetical protein
MMKTRIALVGKGNIRRAIGEGKSLTIARNVKTQRAMLSRLWERTSALKGVAA